MPASAQAANTAYLKVSVDPPSRAEQQGGDQYVVGTRTPTFHVQADLSQAPPGYVVRCHVDMNDSAPCGTQDAQCPVTQCWTMTASHDSDGEGHVLTVEIVSQDGTDDFDVAGLFYSVDTTPPDTTMATLGGNTEGPIDFPDGRHVTFGFASIDDDTTHDARFQCSLTSIDATAPGSWSRCNPEDQLKQKLGLTSSYKFWVRAIDFLGRPDPSPATYVFSPTPCRLKVLGHPHKLRAIVKHGLRLRMTCLQPTGFQFVLLLNNQQQASLHLPSPVLGSAFGQTKAPQRSKTVTLHTLKGLPKALFRQKRLFLGISTSLLGNPPKLVELKLHR